MRLPYPRRGHAAEGVTPLRRKCSTPGIRAPGTGISRYRSSRWREGAIGKSVAATLRQRGQPQRVIGRSRPAVGRGVGLPAKPPIAGRAGGCAWGLDRVKRSGGPAVSRPPDASRRPPRCRGARRGAPALLLRLRIASPASVHLWSCWGGNWGPKWEQRPTSRASPGDGRSRVRGRGSVFFRVAPGWPFRPSAPDFVLDAIRLPADSDSPSLLPVPFRFRGWYPCPGTGSFEGPKRPHWPRHGRWGRSCLQR
jgi:hypothetical protein